MASYRLAEGARQSLSSIARYTQRVWGTERRRKCLAAFDRRFDDLAQSPLKGRARDDLEFGLRSYPEGKHVIFYFIRDNDILIADIQHESMDIAARKESWTRQ